MELSRNDLGHLLWVCHDRKLTVQITDDEKACFLPHIVFFDITAYGLRPCYHFPQIGRPTATLVLPK